MSRKTILLFTALVAAAMVVVFAEMRSTSYVVPDGYSIQYKEIVQDAIDTLAPSICGEITFSDPFVGGISGITEQDARDLCYQSYINAHPDKNICPSTAPGCVYQYAAIWDQPSLCNDDRGCVTNIADRYDNIATCDVLPESDATLCRRSFNPYNCKNGTPCVPGSL